MPKELTEEYYKKLKTRVENARAEADRAQGALNQLMEQLENEFGCRSLKEANQKYQSLEKQEEKAKKEFDQLVEDYEKKWKGEEE